ncbi:hypothetical protein [Alterisphingorhabdus coralli]|uniref:Uncharacterized protein n=1 Tax=Alterisphingorhabdus coralli TaxID=3071408 RepID=A0AA97I364_9SPHN|nr:hypothetical protein [Parasphingorhabdus sp. SCSIO 66989]WOE76445.1 hypothetical protein RB602_06950 [Parasphingorhabdus sp. SCSIO 66989]
MRPVLSTLAATLLLTSFPTAPAFAGWKLIESGSENMLKKGGMTVTANGDWNRQTSRPGKKAEEWTMDGFSLNRVAFYGEIVTGDTLYKDRNKKERPLPTFDSSMLPPDIINWFEATIRIVRETAIFEVDNVQPFEFSGNPGFRFTYSYVDGDELKRRGDAAGAMIDGKFYMMDYSAADIHYFDKDHDKFEAMLQSLRVTS